MAVSMIGKPFQGSLHYIIESSYGADELSAATESETYSPGKFIQNVRIGTGDRHIDVRGIDSPLVKELLEQTDEPTLHIEYNPQVDDAFLAQAANRGSCCELDSFAFCIGVNKCASNPTDDKSYFEIRGAKAGTITISSSKNQPYLVAIDFLAAQVIPGDAIIGAVPQAANIPSGAITAFNIAGEIRKSGGDYLVNTDHLAFITNSINITIENNLTGYTDHDSKIKSSLIEGEIGVSGSVDITLDGGGQLHMTEVLANTAFQIQVDLATAGGAPQITLPGCEWDNSEEDINISGEAVMESSAFTSVPSSCTDLIGTV